MKEFKVEIPEGYVIDEENSTFEKIVFKQKYLKYDKILKELFKSNDYYYIDYDGNICRGNIFKHLLDPNNCTSYKQVKKLLAINKLMNVAKYFNKNWSPDWENKSESKWYIEIYKDNIGTTEVGLTRYAPVYFRTKEFAKQAIEILGEDTIRLALSTDW